MTLIKKGDLTNANSSSSSYIKSLVSDQDDAQALIGAIQDFVSSSTDHLKGEGYDAIRAHLESYIPLLETRIRLSSSIIEAITSANDAMIEYMEDETVLDTNELESLYSKYNSSKSAANDRLSKVNSYDNLEDNQKALREYEYYANDANLINKKIQLIENLPAKDNAVFATLAGVEAELLAYKNIVSDVDTIKFSSN